MFLPAFSKYMFINGLLCNLKAVTAEPLRNKRKNKARYAKAKNNGKLKREK